MSGVVMGKQELTIHVKDELKRTWSRETRHEREEKGLQGTAPQTGGKYAPVATPS